MNAAAPAAPAVPAALCWICQQRPADSAEHRFKASDVRARLPWLSQGTPAYLQRDGRATNHPIGSAKAGKLKFKPTICAHCNDTATQPYDLAWERLSEYLHQQWRDIVRAGSFRLSRPFRGRQHIGAVNVHLFFVKLFGCKIVDDGVPIELARFRQSLRNRVPHPEVFLQIVNNPSIEESVLAAYDSEVHTMRDRGGQLDGATWLYQIAPVGVKVSWIRTGVPLELTGPYWHPSRLRKVVFLAPFEGGTEPSAGPEALL